jgi:UDP-N-acetyl-D-mannosaminuronic acid dehydrogenase
MDDRKVCIMGLGYIGLPTAALLANRGYSVRGVDISRKVVDIVNSGGIHIKEPDLDTFVRSAVRSEKFRAYTKPGKADVFIIAVPTPFHKGHVPNIDYVVSATRSIAPHIEKGNMVVLESTSPIGTTERVRDILAGEGLDASEIFIAYCPERVLPGRIMIELIENDRIVGGINEMSARKVAEFYKSFVTGEVFVTDSKTAEMAKLSENAFRDVNIAFANDLSMLCDKFGIDVRELIRLTNRHPRVDILQPGCGVGGHCIAVDPWFLIHAGGEHARLIKTARMVNDRKSEWVIERIMERALIFESETGRKPVIACMGLAFKADIDDLRESPALYITKRLISENHEVIAVEPHITEHSGLELRGIRDAVDMSDIIVFLVGHKEFRGLHPRGKAVLDFCGVTG